MFRGILLVGFAGGGVYGAYRLLATLAERAGGDYSPLTMEALPLLVPLGIVGAFLGLFIGGMILPKPRGGR